MAFSRPTHRGITGHERDTIEIHSQQECLAPHASGSQCSFAARVTGTDDYHFIYAAYNLLWRKSITFGFLAHKWSGHAGQGRVPCQGALMCRSTKPKQKTRKGLLSCGRGQTQAPCLET